MCFHILQVQIHGIYNREVWFSSEVWKINQESMIAKRGESASSCSRGFIKPLTFSCSARSPDRIQDEIIEKERDRSSASFVCSKFQLSIYDPFSFPIFAMFMLWFLCVCLFSFSMVPEILDWFNICESMRLNPLFGEAWFGIFSSQDEIWFLRFAWKESSWPFFLLLSCSKIWFFILGLCWSSFTWILDIQAPTNLLLFLKDNEWNANQCGTESFLMISWMGQFPVWVIGIQFPFMWFSHYNYYM